MTDFHEIFRDESFVTIHYVDVVRFKKSIVCACAVKTSYNQFVIDKYGLPEVKNEKKIYLCYIYKYTKRVDLKKKHSPEVNSTLLTHALNLP